MAADDLLELSDELIDHIGQLALARHLPSALRLGETCSDLRRRLHAVLLAAEVPACCRHITNAQPRSAFLVCWLSG